MKIKKKRQPILEQLKNKEIKKYYKIEKPYNYSKIFSNNNYLKALFLVLMVINENNQQAEKNSGYSFILNDKKICYAPMYEVNPYIGSIIVKDRSGAKWLIENYEEDLKMLAG